MSVPLEQLIAEVNRLLSDAAEQRLSLRVLGSLAVRLHCPQHGRLLDAMKRQWGDIDLGLPGRDRGHVRDFFEARGYRTDHDTLVAFEGRRFAFDHPGAGFHLDVFVDRLEFCHTIDFGQRIHLDPETLPLSDLLLHKMQIVKITGKDVQDTVVLLLEHSLGGPDDREAIDVEHICRTLAADWGFYYTVTQNLRKVQRFLSDFDVLAPAERLQVFTRIDELLTAIDREPKSLAWRMRAKLGTRVRWYNEVDDPSGTYT